MKNILFLIVIIGIGFLAGQNAFAVTIQPNVDLDNPQMRYTTGASTTLQASTIQIQSNHIFLGTTYYDINSTSGKVFATISEFKEGQDLTVHITNSSLTNVKMFVLGQLKQVELNSAQKTLGDSWFYIQSNTITEVDINSARDVYISFNAAAPAGGGGPPPSGGSNIGGIPNPSPDLCLANPNAAGCNPPVSQYIDLTLTGSNFYANAGDIQNGKITASWTIKEDLVVKSIDAGQYANWFVFPSMPFTLAYLQNPTSYDIPVVLHVPINECNTLAGITINCVNPMNYLIPVKLTASFGNATFTIVTNMNVNIHPKQGSGLNLTAIFGALAVSMIVVAAVVFRNSHNDGKRRNGSRKEGTFNKNINRYKRR